MKIIPDQKTTLDLQIIDLTEEGEGVGKKDGFTWFVKGGLPGDQVKCHVTKVNKSFGKAEAIKLLKASEDRVEAPCSYYSVCGGCQIQDLSYEAQLKFKKDTVMNTLMRIGGFEKPIVRDVLSMKEPYRYRNKGAYAVVATKEGPVIGLYEKNSHRIVPVADCLIQNESHKAILEAFKSYMVSFNVPAYNSKAKEGLVRHLVIRQSDATGEIMVIVVTAKRKLPMTDKMVGLLMGAVPQITSVVQNIQPENTSEILGEACKYLYGNEFIEDHMGALKFQISPLSFFQVNSKQAKRLYDSALNAADLSGDEVVFDLYSGTGTLSLFLAQKAKKVYGVELSSHAVEDARKNAAVNDVGNVEFILGLSEIEVPKLYASGVTADVVVVDPPRVGCEDSVIECIKEMNPKKIVYVSCKPSTMARDMKKLCSEEAYSLSWVQPVDLFGHTTGVECVALLERL